MPNSDNKINIGDTWKSLEAIQINIGDIWKDVAEGYINIGDVWKQFWTGEAPANGDRGVFGGGLTSSYTFDNSIDYITISSTGDAQDFGDLLAGIQYLAGCSNGTNNRGIFAGGQNVNTIQYITINSTSNSTDFGDLGATKYYLSGCSNGTNNRGVFSGGYNTSTIFYNNIIEYITINSTGNSTDFGDLSESKRDLAGCSNGTNNRGIFAGGLYSTTEKNKIEYITINSTGNSTNFGNLTIARSSLAGCSNGTNNRGIFAGGDPDGFGLTNVIEYITINSTGNSTDFGDLSTSTNYLSGCSNGTNNRGVFSGGNSTFNKKMCYITINSTGNATDFGYNFIYNASGSGACSNAD